MRGKEYIEYDNPFDVGMTGPLGFSSGYYAMIESLLTLIGLTNRLKEVMKHNTSEIQLVVSMVAKPGKDEELREVLRRLLEPTRKESGCRRYVGTVDGRWTSICKLRILRRRHPGFRSSCKGSSTSTFLMGSRNDRRL
jgi:hypothetical protein